MRLPAVLILCATSAFAQPADPRVKIENEYVRVLIATDLPRTKSAPHKHDFNRVMVYLNAGEMEIRHEGGRVEKQVRRAGEIAWSAAGGIHTSENLLNRTLRIVEVELKKPPSGKPFHVSARDPLKVNAKRCVPAFDNDQVRVMRCKYPANQREPMHEHLNLGRVTIALNDVELNVKTEGAADRTVALKAGDSAWNAGPVVHSAQASRDAELIIVDLK